MATETRLEPVSGHTRGEPVAVNLFVDFAEAAERLRAHLAVARTRDDALDAFLLAAGLHQILADHLHRDVHSLGKVARHAPEVVGARLGGPAARTVRVARGAGVAVRARRRTERTLTGWEEGLVAFVRSLAVLVAEGLPLAAGPLAARGAELLAPVDMFPPELRRTVVRLPHCFRSFDQRPEDVHRMVSEFAARRPGRAHPVLVVGLRTAGCYLAPLVAAYLEAEGYGGVDVVTVRPEQEWLAHERRALARAAATDAHVLVVDEPPRGGSQLVAAATQLEQAGMLRRSLVLLVPLFGAAPPSSLDAYETVVLPWTEWAVHEHLAPGAVHEVLSSLGLGVEHVERVFVSEPRRGHAVAVFHVELVDGNTRSVCVEGAGLGYLGRHALAVAHALTEFLPEVYGLGDGLLYREWFPEEARLKEPDPARIASYVVARNRALAVPEDTSLRLVGRDPAWELAADMLGRAFGRGRLVVRPFAQRAARRLLETAQPSVVDGSMALSHWFSTDGGARKVGFHRRAFSNEDRSCYDPVYDLAGAANDELDAPLRAEYERLTGEPVAPERWLLYRLLHHRVDRREARAAGDLDRLLACERAMSRIHQRYVGEQLLADVTAPGSGALCAIDVDWVLEVRWLAMPAISPAAALALGALARHGYRPVVATGRSLGEVQDRCRAYRLAGGVAEYGAVVYDHRAGRVRSLLSAQDEAELAALRAVLLGTPGVHLDRAHEHSVRAYRLDARGTSGLDPATIDAALALVPRRDRLRTIPAHSQTDFVAAAVDKGRGVRALAAELREHRIALAVGDSASDLPMLAAAEQAAAPANADAAVRAAGIELMSRPNGAGLLQAVSALLGHRPRHCATCAPANAPSAGAATLLTVLGALDGGAREKARQAARLARL